MCMVSQSWQNGSVSQSWLLFFVIGPQSEIRISARINNSIAPSQKSLTPITPSHTIVGLWKPDFAFIFEAAFCDAAAGSKRTHMGSYVEQQLTQSTNGRSIEENTHTVKDSDLMLS